MIKQKILTAIGKISVVDKLLLAIMIILLCQSILSIFHSTAPESQSDTIDIVARTSLASIFGYFLSGNFASKNSHNDAKTIVAYSSHNELPDDQDKQYSCTKSQTLIIAAICIVSLATLIIIRNFAQITPNNLATVSQLRDFVSSSIGFLVGCGKN